MTSLRRLVRHLLTDERAVRRVLPRNALASIENAIATGEKRHDGEVRFCVEASLPWSYLKRDAQSRERALMLFAKLRVWDTDRNTGVLLYALLADRAIEIVADRGIAAKVDEREWAAICADLAGAFRAGQAEAGVLAALERVNTLLAQHFPPLAVNDNELPDAPVVL